MEKSLEKSFKKLNNLLTSTILDKPEQSASCPFFGVISFDRRGCVAPLFCLEGEVLGCRDFFDLITVLRGAHWAVGGDGNYNAYAVLLFQHVW